MYLNSVRVDTQIGGSDESIPSLEADDGGMYELVFGSIIGNFKSCFARDRFVLSIPEDDSPKLLQNYNLMNLIEF